MPPPKGKSGRKNKQRYWHICDVCGEKFQSSRPDAKTDTPTCRSKLSRQKLKAWYAKVAAESLEYEKQQGIANNPLLKALRPKKRRSRTL